MTLIRAEQAARQAEQAAWRGATWRGTSGSVLGQVAWRGPAVRPRQAERHAHRAARRCIRPDSRGVRVFILHPHVSLLGLVSLSYVTCVPFDPAILRGWEHRSEVERQEDTHKGSPLFP